MKKKFLITAAIFLIALTSCTNNSEAISDENSEVKVEKLTPDVNKIFIGNDSYEHVQVIDQEIDGQIYRIFCMGNGIDDGAIFVINLEKEQLEIKTLKSQLRIN